MLSSLPTTIAASDAKIMFYPPKTWKYNPVGRSGVQQGGEVASWSRVTIDKTMVPGHKERRVASTSTLPLASSSKVTANFKSDANEKPLSDYSCPICFCSPTNAIVMMCGHITCGECLFKSVELSGNKRRRKIPR